MMPDRSSTLQPAVRGSVGGAGVSQTPGHVKVSADVFGGEDLDSKYLGVGGDALPALSVVRPSCRYARHVGSVTVLVHGVAIAVYEVVAVHVVLVAVVIVVYAVGRNLARVCPNVVLKVRVVVVNSTIHHRYGGRR